MSSGKCRTMELDEFGAYIALLCFAWLDGARLLNNEQTLRKLVSPASDEQWARIKKNVLDKMFEPTVDGKHLFNKHQVLIWNDVLDKQESNTKRAKKAAEGRWGTPESDKDSVFPFADFWNCYNKKVERAKCERIYAKLPEAKRIVIKERLPHYVKATPDKNFRKNPQTWLNNACWDDEIVMRRAAGSYNNTQNAPSWGANERDDDVNRVL